MEKKWAVKAENTSADIPSIKIEISSVETESTYCKWRERLVQQRHESSSEERKISSAETESNSVECSLSKDLRIAQGRVILQYFRRDLRVAQWRGKLF